MLKDIINKNESVIPNGDKLALLKENFPSCFRADGTFDLANFSDFLKDKVSVTKEGYGLNFLGKDYAKMLASFDTETIIQPDIEHNAKTENKDSENIYISGDNLDALKHLLKSYSKKIKCIYIDPPYNTGSDGFVYKDNFNFTSEYLQEKLDLDEKQAEHLLAFTKRQSASHSAWLMFMYPRLQLARELLAQNGVIFISIDDNEQANLKLLCDEVFGEDRFVSDISVINNMKGRNDRANVATAHEHLLIYANQDFISNGLPLTEEQLALYKYYDSQGERYALRDLRKRGRPDRREDRPNMYYPIYYNRISKKCSLESCNMDDIAIYPKRGDMTDGRWRWGSETAAKHLDILEARFSKKKNRWDIDYRIYLHPALNSVIEDEESDDDDPLYERTSKSKSFWWGGEISSDVANRELKVLLSGIEPDYPKSPYLLLKILSMAMSENDTILDFFSGSATTAHAVLLANINISQRRNKYILVQIPENLDERLLSANKESKTKIQSMISVLDRANAPHFLDYIGIERIKRVAEKIKEENPLFHGDLGFKHYTLVTPPQNTLDKMIEFNPEADDLIATDEMLSALGGKDTVLTTWLVRDGYGFSPAVQAVKLKNYTAWWCDKHLYLIAPGFSEEDVVELFKKYDSDGAFSPETVVLFGYSFSEWTINEMLDKNLRQLKDGSKQLKINLEVRY